MITIQFKFISVCTTSFYIFRQTTYKEIYSSYLIYIMEAKRDNL